MTKQAFSFAPTRMAAAMCRAQIMEVVSGVLGSAPAPDQPLMEAGVDSLGSVELRNSLGTRFGVELGPTATFDYPTIAALTQHVASLVAPAAARPVAGAGPAWEEDEQAAAALHIVGMSCAYPGTAACPSCRCSVHVWPFGVWDTQHALESLAPGLLHLTPHRPATASPERCAASRCCSKPSHPA